jgi:hypothetical protein
VTPSVFGVAQEGHAVRHETRLVTVRTRWLTIDENGASSSVAQVLETSQPTPLPVSDSPQFAQLIQGGFHALERGRIGLCAAAPTQTLTDLVECDFPAHRPFQNIRSDLSGGLRRFAVALAMEQLVLRLRHAGIAADVDGKDAVEIEGSQLAREPGMIPVVPIFLPGRILLRRERVTREGALKRAIAHGDLTAVTALDVRACAAQALRCR